MRAARLALGDYRGPAMLGPLLDYAGARLAEMDSREWYRHYLGMAVNAIGRRMFLTCEWGDISGWIERPEPPEPGSVVAKLIEGGAFD